MYEAVIGMEVHVQLASVSKLFCSCAADYASAPPNTRTCPVCLGLPGALPTLNRRAVQLAIMMGLALHCDVPELTKWDRKNYSYPDLVKGYQISQYDQPITRDGWLDVRLDGETKRIGIRRAHLEEDTGKLSHVGDQSYMDFNRSGMPLLEIVTEPDIRSAEEARLFLVKLRSILRYLGVSTGNMEDGAMRCEANISLRPVGSQELSNTHVEVKNLNSFRAVKSAIEYEIKRQAVELNAGRTVAQVTMGWDDARGVTVVQRVKESAHDYRYFPEPDLTPLRVSRKRVEELRRGLPELADARQARMMSELGLGRAEAELLTEERPIAEYYDACVGLAGAEAARDVCNWIVGPLFGLMNQDGILDPAERLPADRLVTIVRAVRSGEVSGTTGRTLLERAFAQGDDPREVIEREGLSQVSGGEQMAQWVEAAVAGNPQAVADVAAGKVQAIKFLVGQVMRASRGQANAAAAEAMLRERLNG